MKNLWEKLVVVVGLGLTTNSLFATQPDCLNALTKTYPHASVIENSEKLVIETSDKKSFVIAKPEVRNGSTSWRLAEISPDKTQVFALRIAAGDHISPFLGAVIEVYNIQTQKLVSTIKVNPSTVSFIFPIAHPGMLIAVHSESQHVSDWGLDTRFDRDTVTVGSTYYEIKSGNPISEIPHAKGWYRHKAADDYYKKYIAEFKIEWSSTGQFFAEIKDEEIKIFEVDFPSFEPRLVRRVNKSDIIEKYKQTLGLFATPLTKFERELAARP